MTVVEFCVLIDAGELRDRKSTNQVRPQCLLYELHELELLNDNLSDRP
jgi:hypothetical protein